MSKIVTSQRFIITDSEHCQGRVNQEESWTACINSSNFCISRNTSSYGKTRTTI